MSIPSEFQSFFAETLPDIDIYLVESDIPLSQRPIHATITLVTHCIELVKKPGQDAEPPGKVVEYLGEKWFSLIYAQVHAWYTDRFGAAFERHCDDRLLGVISIGGTAFELRVPRKRSRPGRPGETVWLGFPDGVREDEHPIQWIEAAPNIDRLELKQRNAAEAEALEVANALRCIYSGLLAVGSANARLNGLTSGIIPRIEHAAQLLLEPKPAAVQQAYWELQLACEHALKALGQQQAGTFKETHDLFLLYDAAKPPPDFKRDLLKRVPRWEETVDLRYGLGNRNSRVECLKCYRAVLAIVSGAVRSMRKLGIGRAEFEIRRPPWTKDV